MTNITTDMLNNISLDVAEIRFGLDLLRTLTETPEDAAKNTMGMDFVIESLTRYTEHLERTIDVH